jgi:acyl carrier protein
MVDVKQFIQNFADQFDDEPEGLTLETRFRDIDEWSSLIGLSVIAMVDEEFDIALKGDDVKNSVTVEDLYNKVIAKL